MTTEITPLSSPLRIRRCKPEKKKRVRIPKAPDWVLSYTPNLFLVEAGFSVAASEVRITNKVKPLPSLAGCRMDAYFQRGFEDDTELLKHVEERLNVYAELGTAIWPLAVEGKTVCRHGKTRRKEVIAAWIKNLLTFNRLRGNVEYKDKAGKKRFYYFYFKISSIQIYVPSPKNKKTAGKNKSKPD
jgi:hypothetical protein